MSSELLKLGHQDLVNVTFTMSLWLTGYLFLRRPILPGKVL